MKKPKTLHPNPSTSPHYQEKTMTIITRFAPSPTGYLHIGGARTALFNWLYAKNTGGKFMLRIEDTDKERSTEPAIEAIIGGLKWLGLDWDGDEIYQSQRIKRHQQVVQELLDNGAAYYCYSSKEELEAMRAKAVLEKKPYKYDGTWRNRPKSEAPKDVAPVVRLKAPLEGETSIDDMVQGRVTVKNTEQDDMVLLRSDGTPTYMLAVVVDDHDMGVTDIIRGDDHLTNALRQKLIFEAMGWQTPQFAHIPLIHGADGAKLSKRHGALGVETYRDMGYLPEAMRNYLLRLGWSHGDDEIISTKQAIEWFNVGSIGKSPSRFDFNKLNNLNGYYIREAEDVRLLEIIKPLVAAKLPSALASGQGEGLSQNTTATLWQGERGLAELTKLRILKGMNGLKQRAKLLTELADSAMFYALDHIENFTEKALESLNEEGKGILRIVISELEKICNWEHGNLELVLREISEKQAIKLGNLIAPIRAAITGSHNSPSMFEAMEILGKDETLKRLKSV
jgi:glutamyl-tRNA synthetase